MSSLYYRVTTYALIALISTINSSGSAQQNETSGQADPPQHSNALANETSPYLLMHAHNPVNWYPWGEEALQKAKSENKPIFLSIGYSSCHWCHVMERESFLDEEIAALLNEHFVCIKVDREERPDVDSIYMESLHIFNRLRRSNAGGGWPLSMFLTPDTQPFFGGTYFPARRGDRGSSIGFLSILKSVEKNWREQPDRIRKDAAVVTDLTRKSLQGNEPAPVEQVKKSWIKLAEQGLVDSFDPEYGGFRYSPTNPRIPKFPEPSNLLFLADVVKRNPDNQAAKNMLVKTCEMMSFGGIHDHLGGGFHRYSVDRYWHIPHFEKMMYDNGQLASVYAEAYQLTDRADFKRVVEGILSWVQREMVADEGGFYSALDAESEGEEGKFYRWTLDEVKQTLSDEEYPLFAEAYRLNEPPNFEDEYYAPQLKKMLSPEQDARLDAIRQKLFKIRQQRPRPLLDNKILTSWNGMMIRGFADAGRILQKDEYVEVAARAADFGLAKLVREDGSLYRTHTSGQSKLNAYLDDYAAFINGLLALHRATGDKKWLEAALRIQAKQDQLFWDEGKGGYFYTSSDHEQLLVRTKRTLDSALPSGNSMSAENLLYLSEVTDEQMYAEKSKQTVLSASGLLEKFPIAAPRLLRTGQAFLE